MGAEAVCEAAQIDPAGWTSPTRACPPPPWERLWAVGERLTGDPDLGLHSAESYNPGALSIVGYVILSCRTAGDALDRLARYAPLLNEGLQVRLDHDAAWPDYLPLWRGRGRAQLPAPQPAPGHRDPGRRHRAHLKRLATSPPEPLSVSFATQRRRRWPSTTVLLGPAVRFEQAENTVVYLREALAAGMLSGRPGAAGSPEGDARRRLELLKARGAISGRVQTLLGDCGRGRGAQLASIAAELAMSERSVQRSLSEESTSYREIVDEVRKGLALSHLSRLAAPPPTWPSCSASRSPAFHARLPALDRRFALAVQAGLIP